MKTLFCQRNVIAGAAVAMMLLVVTAIFLMLNKPLPAQTAGAQHAADPVAMVPDDVAAVRPVENFFEVDFMLRGYCCAVSQTPDSQALGGFGLGGYSARAVPKHQPGKGLYLLAQPTEVMFFGDQPGMRLMMVNRTKQALKFTACDSRLSIIQEAQDQHGVWKPIEYLPSSWCGNSYHQVQLNPDYYWEFAAPRYRGTSPTKLRFTLKLDDGSLIHSNEFDGSVNLAQFSIKQGHVPTNIMDPYFE